MNFVVKGTEELFFYKGQPSLHYLAGNSLTRILNFEGETYELVY
jgi:hypothetical protein